MGQKRQELFPTRFTVFLIWQNCHTFRIMFESVFNCEWIIYIYSNTYFQTITSVQSSFLKISILGFLMHESTLKANLKKKCDNSPGSQQPSSAISTYFYCINTIAKHNLVQVFRVDFSISFQYNHKASLNLANHAIISRHHNYDRKWKLREDILAVKGLIVYLNIGLKSILLLHLNFEIFFFESAILAGKSKK